VFTKLIPRNTTIPTRKSEVFSTASDSQTQVEVHVLQGEREMATGNRTLGRFHLVGIPPAPRGIPQIEVTFDIDANGIVNVSAKDLGTGKEQKITITSSSGLGEDEIQKMVKDAETNATEDHQRKQTIEARNRLDGLIYSTDKLLDENKEKLSAAELGDGKSALEEARKALESDSLETLEAAIGTLEKATHKIAEAMYKGASASEASGGGQPGGGGAASGGPGAEDEVIDAEVVDAEGKN
jgi:molecular chaperone DnaK